VVCVNVDAIEEEDEEAAEKEEEIAMADGSFFALASSPSDRSIAKRGSMSMLTGSR